MEGAAQLVSTVGQLVGEEYRTLRSVGGQVAELRDELDTMNAVLRMQSEADDGSVDHFVRVWMNQTAALHDLRARAVVISELHARYGLSREVLSRSASLAPAPRATTHALRASNDPDQFVGISDQAKLLAAKVEKMDVNKERKVFSIVGFGGLGKTTLAMEVCRQLEAMFERQAQVSVSQTFDGRKDLQAFLKRMLQQIVKVKPDKDKGMHQGRGLPDPHPRYLIVIDDVWTIAAWEVIQSKFPRNNNGSIIIVTTRIDTVAKACSPGSDCIHQMKPLDDKDSEKLFLSRTFGPKDASCPKELEAEMGKILKKCAGLPMAIVSIASLLASYQSRDNKDMWERICRSIGSEMESNPTLEGMRQIVTLRYNHIPHHLKLCMMYLSIFSLRITWSSRIGSCIDGSLKDWWKRRGV
ncbi:hypothetical protein ACQ4PT_051734 [Festuca glaucescens]